ncbi:hypothetical protein EHS13_23980 [Paenibacillus psychroresistens]|uniref:Uncharacterized protein n=1 Tax=Paenibacillus psychroresistens TaxID=1778678 RepID=A0A6B8RPF3_9BACL|nr:hypothetical protein [Paenibacillus psychroresistens]QGQ97727.1 hypothetical protein EHS13_23980 [Paenibacillus psychroresistens]
MPKAYFSYLRFLISVLATLCLLTGCDKDLNEDASILKVGDSVSLATSTPSPKKDETLRELTGMLSEVTIFQPNVQTSYGIAYYQDIHSLKQTRTYAFLEDHVQVIVQVPRKQSKRYEELKSAIRVSGDAAVAREMKDEFPSADWMREYIDLRIKGDIVTLMLGDLPPIKLVRSDRSLTYRADTDQLTLPYFRLKNPIIGGSELLLLSQGEKEVVFGFSEPVDIANSNISIYGLENPVQALWKGNRELHVPLQSDLNVLLQVGMDQIFSEQGTYIDRTQTPNSMLKIVPDRKWRSFPDGREIGFSVRDRFYDFILPSVDPSQYIGLIDLYAAINEGAAIQYAFVLERKDLDPVIITESNDDRGMSGFWVNRHIFLYWDRLHVYLYHTDSLQKETLFETATEETQIQEVAYDKADHKLRIVTSYTATGTETYKLDSWESTNLSAPVLTGYPYRKEVPYLGINMLRVQSKGILYSDWKDDQIFTVFEDHRGHRYEVLGELFMVSGDNVILKQSEVPGSLSGISYTRWNIGKPTQNPRAIAKAPGNVHQFGSILLAARYSESLDVLKDYFEYDFNRNTWHKITIPGDHPYVLYQDRNAIYRSE